MEEGEEQSRARTARRGMAMAFLEEAGDEGLHDEELVAVLIAAESRRTREIQQQQRHHHQILHPPPPLSYTAPHKKLKITHNVSSSAASESDDVKPFHSLLPVPAVVSPALHKKLNNAAGIRKEMVVVAKAPQISSMNYNRNARVLSASGVAIDSKPKQEGFMKNNNAVGGTCNWRGPGGLDVKPTGYVKTGGGVISSGRGGGGGGGRRDSDVKHEGFPMSGSSASAAWSGRRPLQELQPWVANREVMERPSSTSTNTWVQAEKTSCSPKECSVEWFSGLSGVAMFKECQNAALRTLLPSDYTMLNGKPFIKKTGWRKIAFFFNVSFEIKDKNIQFDQQTNVLRAEFVVRASMPSGRFTDSWGSCDRGEKRFSKPNHDIPSTAETRAKTRACQDLLGIGEYKADSC